MAEQYSVSGMSCAACSARVEKAVSAVEGVTDCAVSLLTNAMRVEGTAAPEAVIAAVEAAGYGAARKGGESAAPTETHDGLEDRETPKLWRRFWLSLGFVLALMYTAMGHNMLALPLPPFLEQSPLAIGLTQLLLAAIVLVVNQKFFISGFLGLVRGAPNMDSLVALGSAAGFVYSTARLYAMCAAPESAAALLHDLYFESSAMILALITLGKTLEARAKGKTTNALKSLMALAPQSAVVLRGDIETEIPIAQVKKGDVFLVRPGQSIPVDGLVLEGQSAVNEAALSGESLPVDKAAGDTVSAATLNESGFLRCEATRVGEDTTLSQIIRMVSDAAATKAPIAKMADKVSGVFVPAVLALALVTALGWLLAGQSAGFALARGISVLVISCPCALGLATPVAIMVGSGLGARHGILFKNAAALEQAGRIDIVVLDKTGTLTEGRPAVTELLPAEGLSDEELLALAAALESKSEHPLAKAMLAAAEERGLPLKPVEGFESLAGRGLRGRLEGQELLGGSRDYIAAHCPLPAALTEAADRAAAEGKTPLFFAFEGKALGFVAVTDTLKSDSAEAVRDLKAMGLRVVMLSGDNARTAHAVAQTAGIDEVIAEVRPQGKEEVIRRLQREGRVAMVGDGINDAPALTRAELGIAVAAGADVAIDAAQVVLVKNRLRNVPAALRLGRQSLRIIRQNLFWAFLYNIIGIPVAAGLFIRLLGWQLNPMLGAAAMSLSSFCVVSNALRLNLFDPHDGRHDRKHKQKIHHTKENEAMTKTMKIEGMMCMHCEARVKKCLEALVGVIEAQVSHETDSAVVTLAAPLADETLKAAVEAQDYKVLSIE